METVKDLNVIDATHSSDTARIRQAFYPAAYLFGHYEGNFAIGLFKSGWWSAWSLLKEALHGIARRLQPDPRAR